MAQQWCTTLAAPSIQTHARSTLRTWAVHYARAMTTEHCLRVRLLNTLFSHIPAQICYVSVPASQLPYKEGLRGASKSYGSVQTVKFGRVTENCAGENVTHAQPIVVERIEQVQRTAVVRLRSAVTTVCAVKTAFETLAARLIRQRAVSQRPDVQSQYLVRNNGLRWQRVSSKGFGLRCSPLSSHVVAGISASEKVLGLSARHCLFLRVDHTLPRTHVSSPELLDYNEAPSVCIEQPPCGRSSL